MTDPVEDDDPHNHPPTGPQSIVNMASSWDNSSVTVELDYLTDDGSPLGLTVTNTSVRAGRAVLSIRGSEQVIDVDPQSTLTMTPDQLATMGLVDVNTDLSDLWAVSP